MRNVTFFVTFPGIPAQKITAYYFCDEWNIDSDYMLRIPYERSHYGVSGVLAIDLEIYSDEYTIPRLHTSFPNHIPQAVESALAQARATVKSSPAEFIELIKGVQRNASNDLYSAKDLRNIRDEAKRAASQQAQQFKKRLMVLKNQLANQKRLRRTNRSKRDVYDSYIQQTESRIDSVEETIKTLRRVR